MHAKNSKPQGLDDDSKRELLKTDRRGRKPRTQLFGFGPELRSTRQPVGLFGEPIYRHRLSGYPA